MADIIRIDLATGAASAAPLTGELAGLGGRGLTSALVAAEVDPACDALGPDNLLVFAAGILAGTSVPNGGRISVGAKSPLTGGIKEANAGGQTARKLANLGARAVAVSGAASELSLIEIDSSGTRVKAAPQLKGLGSYATIEALRAQYGDDATFVCCGPAGEMGAKAAAVITTTPDFLPRTASRGGLGAVMGSKNLKALVINDAGAGRAAVANPAALKAAASGLSEGIRSHPLIGGWEAMGTAMLVNASNAIGSLPTKNFSAGQFDGAEAISGETMLEQQAGRANSQAKHRCMTGCIVNCSQVYTDADGAYVTSGFEYETLGMIGANCGISDLDQVARLDRLCDDLGLDTIETGVALGVAMEGGLLPWGDGAAAHALLAGLTSGDANARLIADGCVATGTSLGVARIPAVKGQGIPAWEPRALKGTGTTYATSPMGADHTCGNIIPGPNMPDYDANVPEGQAQMSQFVQSWFAAVDTLGLCLFASIPALDIPTLPPLLVQAAGAVLGEELSEDYLGALGTKVIMIERDFNRRAGFTAADDRLPAFMTTEPLAPSGNVFDVSEADLDSVFAG
ncbi:MAG: aldehyde ferredoxin oxidoreductase [Actinobacteria bacterium]|nr:aldehyde ferredoxin oxidoreductase [Actinomycetota bacterium]